MVVAAVAVLAVVGGLVAYFVIKGGSEGVAGAAEVLPADAVQVRYVDRDAAAERLGVGDIEHGASSEDIDKYLEAMQDAPWAVTPFGLSLAVMEDASFNELDVDWWALVELSSGSETAQAPLNVYRMDDDLDLADVADALADAGLKESEVDGHRRFQGGAGESTDASGLIDGNLPARDLSDVTVVEDEHLIVVGAEPERVLDVIDGDADSLADEGDLSALGDTAESTEFALVMLGDGGQCGDTLLARSGATPKQLAAIKSESGLADLGTPDARGVFVVSDDDDADAVGVLAFGSEDEAEADAEARETWLEEGSDPVTRQPIADCSRTAAPRPTGIWSWSSPTQSPGGNQGQRDRLRPGRLRGLSAQAEAIAAYAAESRNVGNAILAEAVRSSARAGWARRTRSVGLRGTRCRRPPGRCASRTPELVLAVAVRVAGRELPEQLEPALEVRPVSSSSSR